MVAALIPYETEILCTVSLQAWSEHIYEQFYFYAGFQCYVGKHCSLQAFVKNVVEHAGLREEAQNEASGSESI